MSHVEIDTGGKHMYSDITYSYYAFFSSFLILIQIMSLEILNIRNKFFLQSICYVGMVYSISFILFLGYLTIHQNIYGFAIIPHLIAFIYFIWANYKVRS